MNDQGGYTARAIERITIAAIAAATTIAIFILTPPIIVWATAGLIAAAAVSLVVLAFRADDAPSVLHAIVHLIRAILGLNDKDLG